MAHPSAGPNPTFPAIGMTAWAKVGRWWQKATVVKVPEPGEIVDEVRRSGDRIKCVIHKKKRDQKHDWVKRDLVVPRDKGRKGDDKPA